MLLIYLISKLDIDVAFQEKIFTTLIFKNLPTKIGIQRYLYLFLLKQKHDSVDET